MFRLNAIKGVRFRSGLIDQKINKTIEVEKNMNQNSVRAIQKLNLIQSI